MRLKMSPDERKLVATAWAKSRVLCGYVDPEAPEEDFPKGRLVSAQKTAREVHSILSELLLISECSTQTTD
jgi:hypothetical protein